jgi:asparagine synthase (glutamine-hydrolysing)
MCGIAGILTSNGTELNPADLAKLAKALAHRGPDGEGIWINSEQTAGLVHRRLAIIDTTDRGHQPMHSTDEAYTIVFNGEIYNFLELREQLQQLGSQFHSESDTEVIIEAWHHWGKEMLHRFNGMWAIAIRNNSNGEVFLARDRFGIKPLLYTQSAGRFAFASEMRALRALPWLDRQLDRQVAARFLFDPFSIEGGERTLLASVRRLPAGHLATVKQGRIEVERWWRTTDHLVSPPTTEAQQADRFRELFFDAVQLRMRSDVPLGTCLSGGFDSSAIVCAMDKVAADKHAHLREAKEWRHAFIASFPGDLIDETPHALEAAAYAHVTPHVLKIDEDNSQERIESVLEDLDDLYISLPNAPWLIYRELRRAQTYVSIDGHGADELMGGYRQDGEDFGFKLRNMLSGLTRDHSTIHMLSESAKLIWLRANEMCFLRDHRWIAPADLETPFDHDQLPAEWGALNIRLYEMFHATVLPTILRNFDRLSMAHGIEVRMPFMDWRLVTYVMSLPDAAKSNDVLSKLVARNAMKGLMPESIRANPHKIGFNSPMIEWLNGPLKQWVNDVLAKPNEEFDSLVDTAALRARVASVSEAQSWDWQKVGRLWPYINLKWMLDRAQ